MDDFNQKAKDWDAKPIRIERAHAVAEGIRARVRLTPQMAAFEYGCGTGLLSFALQPYLGHITLADNSTGMLAVLQEKIAASGIRNMTPLQLDLLSDALPPDQYQLIYTLMTLHHIAATEKVLRAFYTLLADSGHLCVADLDAEDGTFHEEEFHGHLGFDRNELSEKSRQAGFRTIGFTTVFHMIKDVNGVSKDFPIFLMVAEKS